MAKLNAWEPYDWDFGAKPVNGECYRIKVRRGYIYLHLRAQHRTIAGKFRPTGINLWQFTCSFGANSDDSYTGGIGEVAELEVVKRFIEEAIIPSIGEPGRVPDFAMWKGGK